MNIGFGENSTHTRKLSSYLKDLKLEQVNFPLIHPKKINRAIKADNVTFYKCFNLSIKSYVFKFLKFSIKGVKNGIFK